MSNEFQPWECLVEGLADAACRAIVTIPARNEEASLTATLDALAAQVDLERQPLAFDKYEILLLLNNCTDGSARVVREWKGDHSAMQLHVAERALAAHEAFVGTARRMLMDTAWRRLAGNGSAGKQVCGILSTDSDTFVSADWIAQNLAALEQGADAVGGVIALMPGELEALPHGVQEAYVRDRTYQRLVGALEDRFDPQEGDPWPRHLEHFGASLACTPDAYARAGGMPAVTPLEDVAFVNALRGVGARLRHAPEVKVFTSSRLHGRVDVGLSGQLRLWQAMSEQGEAHRVLSAAWLAHRFRTLGEMRKEAARKGVAAAVYLHDADCERVAEETFRGEREGEITRVNEELAVMLAI